MAVVVDVRLRGRRSATPHFLASRDKPRLHLLQLERLLSHLLSLIRLHRGSRRRI